MEQRSLTSSRPYFREVLEPNRDAYFGGRVTFASAFNFATSLFHFHDWLFQDYRHQLIARFGLKPDEPKPRPFWLKVQGIDERFGYIHDVANASKHMILSGPASGMKDISQTSLQSVGFGQGRFGVGRYSGPSFVILHEGTTISFDECARAMLDYWRGLQEDLAEPPTS